jgi:hypothetical protein
MFYLPFVLLKPGILVHTFCFLGNLFSEVTYEGEYSAGVERLATLLVDHYGSDLFPVVSVGDLDDTVTLFPGVKGGKFSREMCVFFSGKIMELNGGLVDVQFSHV